MKLGELLSRLVKIRTKSLSAMSNGVHSVQTCCDHTSQWFTAKSQTFRKILTNVSYRSTCKVSEYAQQSTCWLSATKINRIFNSTCIFITAAGWSVRLSLWEVIVPGWPIVVVGLTLKLSVRSCHLFPIILRANVSAVTHVCRVTCL